jgi:hypothetical protein
MLSIKSGDEQRFRNNRILVPLSLNQCCAPDSCPESMLLAFSSKNVYRQHRSVADTKSPPNTTTVVIICSGTLG